MSHIFISYTRMDFEKVRPIAEALEKKGWSVWWDPNIPPGKDVDDVILEELNKAGCVIVIWSKNSVSRKYVKGEARKGLEKDILVPVAIEQGIEPPLDFHSIQTVSLIEWDGSEDSVDFERLLSGIQAIIGAPPISEPASEKADEPHLSEETGRRQPEILSRVPDPSEPVSLKPEPSEAEKITPSNTKRFITIGAVVVLSACLLIAGLWLITKPGKELARQINVQEEKPPMAGKEGRFFVKSVPADAAISIRNIEKEFRQGMILAYGKYLVKVSADGYHPQQRWIQHDQEGGTSPEFKLLKIRSTGEVEREPATDASPQKSGAQRIDYKQQGRLLTTGKVRGLTVLVEFADVYTNISASEVDKILNAENNTPNGNYCSVREYFKIMSSGKLDYSNRVVGPVKLSNKQSHYINNFFIKEALDIVVQRLGIDLSEFDSKKEGIVDALNFMYAGKPVYSGNLWPHSSTVNLAYGGVRTQYYSIVGSGERSADISIGQLCRNVGYMLCRFPPLYDYGSRDGDFTPSQGIGAYDLMGSGSHLDQGRTPAPISAYLRLMAGWVDNVILLNKPGVYEAKHGNYSTVFKYETDKPNEFFLVENRSQLDLDFYLPSSGLAIYHCDTLGSNEWQNRTKDRHYQVALLQADGKNDLENNRNSGDTGDLYDQVNGVALSRVTTPSSRKWDGSDSGLTVLDIGKPGKIISFRIGRSTVSKAGGEAREAVSIPAADPSGASSKILIHQTGKVKSIEITVDITHTYIGDLQVELQAPSGKSVLLHNRTKGSQDNLMETYRSGELQSLAVMKGESIQGYWVLHIRDRTDFDTGRLNRWQIEIDYETIDDS